MASSLLNDPYNYLTGAGGLAGDDIAKRMYDMAAAQQGHNWAQAQQAMANVAEASGPPLIPTERQKLVELSSRARELFVSRMGGIRSKFFVPHTDCVYTHVVDERVILFYCFSGKEGVASEPVDVFPSDQLIAQFRMITS